MNEAASDSKKRVTLADIARDSDVSTATVSLVLRDKPGVSDETRQRVLDSAQALGYVYTPSNQAIGRALPDNFGVVVKSRPNDPPASNSFYGGVLAGIESVCRRNQINLNYADLLVDSRNNPLETPRLMLDGGADGLLIVGLMLDERMVRQLQRLNTPVVLVDAYASENPFDSVVTNNNEGAYQATEFLIQKSHRHIGIVGSLPDAYPSVRERREGYLRALADYGLEPLFADCILHPSVVEPYVTDLLTRHPEVTAILGCNDDVAIAAMRTAQRLGRRVPADLSVIGFDNIEMSQAVLPRLTTMRVDMMGMGRMAAYMLLNRAEHPEAGLARTIISPDLVERESVTTCPDGA